MPGPAQQAQRGIAQADGDQAEHGQQLGGVVVVVKRHEPKLVLQAQPGLGQAQPRSAPGALVDQQQRQQRRQQRRAEAAQAGAQGLGMSPAGVLPGQRTERHAQGPCQHRGALALARDKCELGGLDHQAKNRAQQGSPTPGAVAGPACRVVQLCPQGAQRQHHQGLGRQFGQQAGASAVPGHVAQPPPDHAAVELGLPLVNIQHQVVGKQGQHQVDRCVPRAQPPRQQGAALAQTDQQGLKVSAA